MFRGRFHNTYLVQGDMLHNGSDEGDGCLLVFSIPFLFIGVSMVLGSITQPSLLGLIIGFGLSLFGSVLTFYKMGKYIDRKKKIMCDWHKFFFWEREKKYFIGYEDAVYIKPAYHKVRYKADIRVYELRFKNVNIIWDYKLSLKEAQEEAAKLAHFLEYKIIDECHGF
jgi:hypothetical protein